MPRPSWCGYQMLKRTFDSQFPQDNTVHVSCCRITTAHASPPPACFRMDSRQDKITIVHVCDFPMPTWQEPPLQFAQRLRQRPLQPGTQIEANTQKVRQRCPTPHNQDTIGSKTRTIKQNTYLHGAGSDSWACENSVEVRRLQPQQGLQQPLRLCHTNIHKPRMTCSDIFKKKRRRKLHAMVTQRRKNMMRTQFDAGVSPFGQ